MNQNFLPLAMCFHGSQRQGDRTGRTGGITGEKM